MQTRKISSKLTLILYTILAVFVCLSVVAITTTSNQSMTTQAAENTESKIVQYVNFIKPAGLDTNLYCIVTFYGGSPFTQIIKYSDQGSETQTPLAISGTGKLEITVPMYCFVSGLTGATQNGSTYYLDVTSNTSISFTVTFNDQGYFGGNTL